CGGTGGGGASRAGISRFTALSWTGMVMISMTSSTSNTSTSGVVLMSTIGSGSGSEPTRMFRPMDLPSAPRRLGEEADVGNARLLRGPHHLAHRLVVGA